MEFSLMEDTVLLKNNAERFLKDKSPASFVKAMIKDEKGYSPAIWKEMAELGWLGFIYDEKYGGLGGGIFDLFILFREIGKTLLPSPFFCSAVLAGLILDEGGEEKLKECYLPAIIQGEKILTAAMLDEQGKWDAKGQRLEAREQSGSSYELNGTRLLVPFAHIADEIITCANVKGGKTQGPTLFQIDRKAPGLKVIPLPTLTGEKTFAVVYENVKASGANRIGETGKGDQYVNRVLPKAVLLKCGEMLGGMERAVEMTVEYTKQRFQFGRPIGSLQVIQHYCADMSTLLESTRLLTYQAASLFSDGLPCNKEIGMAKAWCGDAYKKVTSMGHQIHAGIGFTEEHDLHLYFKHAIASDLAFGDSRDHRAAVAREMGL